MDYAAELQLTGQDRVLWRSHFQSLGWPTSSGLSVSERLKAASRRLSQEPPLPMTGQGNIACDVRGAVGRD